MLKPMKEAVADSTWVLSKRIWYVLIICGQHVCNQQEEYVGMC